MVWEGRFDCGLKIGTADLVLFKPVQETHEAVFIVRPDEKARSPQPVGQSLFTYKLAQDPTLDLFRLSAPTMTYLGSTLQPERQVELAKEAGGETLQGRFGDCKPLTLQHLRYPQPVYADLLATVKARPGGPLSKPAVRDQLSSCILLSAWAAQLQASVPGLDPKRLSIADRKNAIFRASVFHPAAAQAYAGATTNVYEMTDCLTNPVAFENSLWMDRVLLQGIDQAGGFSRQPTSFRPLPTGRGGSGRWQTAIPPMPMASSGLPAPSNPSSTIWHRPCLRPGTTSCVPHTSGKPRSRWPCSGRASTIPQEQRLMTTVG